MRTCYVLAVVLNSLYQFSAHLNQAGSVRGIIDVMEKETGSEDG